MNKSGWSVFLEWNLAVLADLLFLLKVLIPTIKGWILMGTGAVIGGWAGYIFGGFDAAILWLFGFTIIDFILGIIAAAKHRRWQSKVMYRGIFKKCFIFVMIAICHGVDVALGVDFVRTTCIFAYLANEVGSILENVERMGYGDIIPSVLRNALQILQDKGQGNTGLGTTKERTEKNE